MTRRTMQTGNLAKSRAEDGRAKRAGRPADLTPADKILQLQRLAGNRAVGRLLKPSPVQRRIDYGDDRSNARAEMTIPSGTSLYHATSVEHIGKIRNGIRVDVSKSTQLGKGFYTSWFGSDMEKYGAFAVHFELARDLTGQQVFTDKIVEADRLEIEAGEDEDQVKAVKQNWDDGNDFLYTPKLDEQVNGQDVPHQVKITANGVDALPLGEATVLNTRTGDEEPLSEFKAPPPRTQLFAGITGHKF